MKPEIFEIRFESPRKVFHAGEHVRGEVVLMVLEPMKMKSLSIFFYGRSKTEFVDPLLTKKKRFTCKAKEIYIEHTNRLCGTGTDSMVHPPGEHKYPFSFTVGTGHPSSFQGDQGNVRYSCKATIHRSWSFDIHTGQEFTVVHHLDLNSVPNAAMPISKIHQEPVKSLFSSNGFVSTKLKVHKSGFVFGEQFKYDIFLVNKSEKDVKKIELDLHQCVTCTAMLTAFGKPEKRQRVKVVTFGILSHPTCIKPNLEEHISKEGTIPDVAPSGLHGCDIIDIEYKLAVKVHVGRTVLLFECDIVIGTIPLEAPSSSSCDASALTFLPRSRRPQSASYNSPRRQQSASYTDPQRAPIVSNTRPRHPQSVCSGPRRAPIASEPGLFPAPTSSQPRSSRTYRLIPPPRSIYEPDSEPPPTYEEAVADMEPFLDDKHKGRHKHFQVPID